MLQQAAHHFARFPRTILGGRTNTNIGTAMSAGAHPDQRSQFDAFFPGRSEDFLRLLGAWSIPFALVDEADAVVFWNRGSVKFYGLSEDEALGRKFADLVAEHASVASASTAGLLTRRYEA